MAETYPSSQAYFSVGSPGKITQANITLGDSRPFATTTVTITFQTVHKIPIGGLLQFEFDPINFVFPDDKSTVTCSTNLASNAICDFKRMSRVIVRDLFTLTGYEGGQNLTFTIDNCLIDIDRRMVTDSWKITTLTSDEYAIDRLTNGLSLSFQCNSPCLTCADTNPSYCLSCNPLSTSTILYGSRCYTHCPQGLFLSADANQCLPCDPTCLSCKPDNPNYCTGCDPRGGRPFLDGSTCVDACMGGYYADLDEGRCERCGGGCLTCSGNATQCMSCNVSSS